jgi:hypothetical protein
LKRGEIEDGSIVALSDPIEEPDEVDLAERERDSARFRMEERGSDRVRSLDAEVPFLAPSLVANDEESDPRSIREYLGRADRLVRVLEIRARSLVFDDRDGDTSSDFDEEVDVVRGTIDSPLAMPAGEG